MTQIIFIQIVTMWNKINELSRENLSQQQIALKLGIHRDTVRRYQIMSEAEFNEHLRREARRHPCKLDPYRDFIVDHAVTTEKILSLISENPNITTEELARECGLTTDGVYYHTKRLREKGVLIREGGRKEGYWVIVKKP